MPLPPQRLSRIWRIAQLEARLNGVQKGRLCSPLVTAIFTPILDALSMSTNYGLIFGAAQLGLFAEKPLTRDGLSFSFRTGKTVALVSTSGGNRSTAARLLLLMEVIAGLKKAVLSVFHALNLACAFCDCLLVLNECRIAAWGTPRDICTPADAGGGVPRAYGRAVAGGGSPLHHLPEQHPVSGKAAPVCAAEDYLKPLFLPSCPFAQASTLPLRSLMPAG